MGQVLTLVVDGEDAAVEVQLSCGAGVACDRDDGAARAIGGHQVGRPTHTTSYSSGKNVFPIRIIFHR